MIAWISNKVIILASFDRTADAEQRYCTIVDRNKFFYLFYFGKGMLLLVEANIKL